MAIVERRKNVRTRTRARTRLATGAAAVGAVGAAVILTTASGVLAGAASPPGEFLSSLHKPVQIASTVPPDGDVNPYGVTVVSQSIGRLVKGETLVSNFNDKANVQGTGSTIEEIAPHGTRSTFAHLTSLPPADSCPGGIGLSTALSILPGGYVVVGSIPSGPGGALPSQNPAGCLIVLNSAGAPVETWSNPDIDGPWDMTTSLTSGGAEIFLSNVLSGSANGTTTTSSGLCTVVRIDVALPTGGAPEMTGTTVIGSALPWRADKAAFVLGPTGAALSEQGTLYVAETLTNQIIAIPQAPTRTTPVVYGTSTLTSRHYLNAPLGLMLAPDGDLIAVNGNDGNAVEITPQGRQIARHTLVPKGAGDLFGLTLTPNGRSVLFVNDGTNALDLAKG